MAQQPSLTYVESFDSIATWTNNFSSGCGANRFASVPVGGTNPVPDATRITTSSAAWTTQSSGGLQRDTVYRKLMMLVTGTTNNTNSLAFDFFLDFTGVNAGTLSFDWQTVFNGATSSNRAGTLKIFATVDGINFTELTSASVTITNYTAASGSVSNISMPAIFNNNANARLRFYYYNSAGGSTGSRPLIALDNIKVVAAGNSCVTPVASATSLFFSNVTPVSVQGSFTAANPAPDEYLVVATSQGGLTGNPSDSTIYNPGDIVGGGEVIYRGAATSFTANNLSPQTNYTFYIFSLNIFCNGFVKYNVINPLTGIQATPAGPPCTAPSAPPSNLIFGANTTSSISGSFTGVPDASEYLVIAATSSILGAQPADGIVYNSGDTIGAGTVVYRGATKSFLASSLNHSTVYYFFIYGLNNYACSNGPAYSAIALSGSDTTAPLYNCATPLGDASHLSFTCYANSIFGSFHPFPAQTDGYMVVMSANSSLTALPQNNTIYAAGNSLGGGTIISMGSNYSFSATNLPVKTGYHFFVFAYNDVCIGGPIYRTTSYTSGFASTTNAPVNNFYFGNLHAHSSYSDGNKDNPSFTPADDYDYAKNALCMDFLGISEHNHYSQNGNPGMLLSYYQQGLAEAANFTATNPGFLALYGMEWGTANTFGGHVLVYGVDSLLGWEQINGTPNYDIFVAKNDYTSDSGLFKKVNDFSSVHAFATLAHPSFSDFDTLAYLAYDGRADSALAGIAVENGPAFSTNTSYSQPGSDMYFLPYFQAMLAKGYRVAPMIDHDNHNTTFGTTAFTRTAVIAPSISKTDFMQAMTNMRFYATQDCDTKAEILVYNETMGTEMTHSFPPALTVYADDPTNAGVVPVIKLLCGTPGSGATATVIKTVNEKVLNFTDFSLPDSATAYYYADIEIGGKRTITAPVWYTRIDTGIILINSLNTPKKGQENNLVIRNNPSADEINIDLAAEKSSTATISVYTISGQKRYTQKIKISHGRQSLSIPISTWPAGLYIVEARFAREKIVRKFLHQP